MKNKDFADSGTLQLGNNKCSVVCFCMAVKLKYVNVFSFKNRLCEF